MKKKRFFKIKKKIFKIKKKIYKYFFSIRTNLMPVECGGPVTPGRQTSLCRTAYRQ